MKWTTANLKHPNYTAKHELFVGTHTGSFKRKSNPMLCCRRSFVHFLQICCLLLSRIHILSQISAI